MARHFPRTKAEIAARLDDLAAKLSAREGNMAYAQNCVEIRAEIARLEALQNK